MISVAVAPGAQYSIGGVKTPDHDSPVSAV